MKSNEVLKLVLNKAIKELKLDYQNVKTDTGRTVILDTIGAHERELSDLGSDKPMIRYFISFQHNSNNGGSGFGNIETRTAVEIKSIDQVTNIAQGIARDKGLDQVLILNYIRLN